MKRLIHRMNQTAHISLQLISISKSVETEASETKVTGCAVTYWRAPPQIPQCSCLPSRWSVAPLVCLAARWSVSARPVRGVLRLVADTRNPFFHRIASFLDFYDFPYVLRGLLADYFAERLLEARLLLQCGEPNPQILSYPQA